MNINATPNANRTHIAFFGNRNSGKSSLINAVTGQNLSIVSDVAGTTTDPVLKTMEILPIGPCVLIDTAGLDDVGELGNLRIKKSMDVLAKTDVVIYVSDNLSGLTSDEINFLSNLKKSKMPVLLVNNKIDLQKNLKPKISEDLDSLGFTICSVSCKTGEGVKELKEQIASSIKTETLTGALVGDIVCKGDIVVLVTPIDSSAPKGRMILPQQQVLRDVLECGGISVVTTHFELAKTLDSLKSPPKIVITDSQVFAQVSEILPKSQPLTSFSILFARNKGDVNEMIKGAKSINSLNNGDKVLIAEACTHHVQSEDIGRVKIPKWLREHTGKELIIEHCAGYSYPQNLDEYKLVVHCGACMLNKREMQNRIELATAANVPIVNYGVLIATVTGILDRATAPLIHSTNKYAMENEQ